MDPFVALAKRLTEVGVRFALIGVWGANFYARSGATAFTTEDYDVFLPPDADTALKAWQVCRTLGFELTSAGQGIRVMSPSSFTNEREDEWRRQSSEL